MRKFLLRYLLPRIAQYFMVIFLGVTLTFIIPRLSPNDPVERQVAMIMQSGSQVSPEAITHLRTALSDMYGLHKAALSNNISRFGAACFAAISDPRSPRFLHQSLS